MSESLKRRETTTGCGPGSRTEQVVGTKAASGRTEGWLQTPAVAVWVVTVVP